MPKKTVYSYLLPIVLAACMISEAFAASAFEKALAQVDQRNYAQAAMSLEDLLKTQPTHPKKQQSIMCSLTVTKRKRNGQKRLNIIHMLFRRHTPWRIMSFTIWHNHTGR